jgi:undecaprenyl-diphosphatase
MKRHVLNISLGIMSAVIFVLLLIFDRFIMLAVPHIRIKIIGSFFQAIGIISSEIIVLVFVSILFFSFRKSRHFLPWIWISAIASISATFIIKIIVQRARPFEHGLVQLEGVAKALPWWDYSFPSATTAFVFCFLPFFWKIFPRFRFAWLGFCILTALSRIYFGLHFPTDVAAGAFLGTAISLIILSLKSRYK